jgi:hypothetical protein
VQRLCQYLRGCPEAEGLSRATIQLGGDRVQGGLVELAQVAALGEVLAEQAVGVLVSSALPGAARVAEVDLDAGLDGELLMFGHLSFGITDRAELKVWQARLEELGIPHGEIVDAHYGSGLSFRDPDNIALELFAPPG